MMHITVLKNSANVIDSHTPSTPKIAGKAIRHTVINTKVLINAIMAETFPLENAVNKDDVNIFIPANKKLILNIPNPSIAILYTFEPFAANIVIINGEKIIALIQHRIEQTNMNIIQYLNTFLI